MGSAVVATSVDVALWVWFLGWAIALSIVDIREHRLPNRMVAVCLTGCVVLVFVGAAVSQNWGIAAHAFAGCAAAIAVFSVLHVLGGLGMGDVKYAAVTGLALGTAGWSAVWWGHFLGFVLAGAVVVVGLVTRRVQRRSRIAFGPFMATGALVVGIGTFVSL